MSCYEGGSSELLGKKKYVYMYINIFKDLFLYLRVSEKGEREEGREERETERGCGERIFHLLVYSSNDLNGLGWVEPKPGTRTSIWTCHFRVWFPSTCTVFYCYVKHVFRVE